jgi:hypothetical protein
MDEFFSDGNKEYIHSSIIKNVSNMSGYSIGRQNDSDLETMMGKVYTDLRGDTEHNVDSQVSNMNQSVISAAVRMVINGIKSDLYYLNDISKNPVPPDLPYNTSLYGTRLNK